MSTMMYIFKNESQPEFALPGLTYHALAGFRDGLKAMAVAHIVIEPGGETPVHYHDCEEVVVVISGSGNATVDDVTKLVEAETTLVFPTGVVHQMVNAGDEPLHLHCSFALAACKTFEPDGTEIPVPWAIDAGV